MAWQTVFDGNTDKTISLGGQNLKTGLPNPTSIEGYFLGSKTTKSDYGDAKLHMFQTSEGIIGVWGKSRLNRLLENSALIGQMTLVTFTGMIAPTKKGRKPSYGFKVQHDPENTISVTQAVNSGSPAYDDEEGDEELFAESSLDEVAPARAVAPAAPAAIPSSDSRAKIQALLNSRRQSS